MMVILSRGLYITNYSAEPVKKKQRKFLKRMIKIEGDIRTKKLIVAVIIVLLFAVTVSCSPIYNLNNFILPDDAEFLAVIESLNTPEKICKYMEDNFEFEAHPWDSYSPYQMWLVNRFDKVISSKMGDCNDYSTFAIFVAHYHGYEVYQAYITYKDKGNAHMIGIFVEDDSYTYSDVWIYQPIYVDTFKEVIEHHSDNWNWNYEKYKIYDYEMNIIEEGGN